MDRVHPRPLADIDLAVSGLLGLADLLATAEARLADNLRVHAFAIDEAIGRIRAESECRCASTLPADRAGAWS